MMTKTSKLTTIIATIFLCLILISVFNAQRFNLLSYKINQLAMLGNEENNLIDEANRINTFEEPDKGERLLEERYKKSLEYEKEFLNYEKLIKQFDTPLLPKQYRKFIELEKKYYQYQKETILTSKKSYTTVNINMKPFLTLARAFKKEKLIIDKVNKNDFSSLPEMRAQMKQIAQEMKDASAFAKSVEDKEISSEDVEYYQKQYEYYQAWADYLEVYSTSAVEKKDDATRRTSVIVKWLDEHPLDKLYQKSYESYIKPYDEKLQKNIRVFEAISKEQKEYMKPVLFFFALY